MFINLFTRSQYHPQGLSIFMNNDTKCSDYGKLIETNVLLLYYVVHCFVIYTTRQIVLSSDRNSCVSTEAV